MAAPPPQPGHLTGSAASSTEATFAVAGEDHTLGNALVGALNAQPQVAFAGYTVPHPADDVVHVRVQTTPEGGRTAAEALKVAAGGACRPVGKCCERCRLCAHTRPLLLRRRGGPVRRDSGHL